jgi:hypothetical protein
MLPPRFPPNTAWAPLVAIAQRQRVRSGLVKYAMCQSAIAFDEDPPAPGPGRSGTRGAGSRPGGSERPHVDFKGTKWGKMLAHPSVSDPRSKQGKLFRRRFRVPYPVFLQIVADALERFPSEIPDCRGRLSAPLKIKILGWLRTLGRASCFDDVSELSGVGESTAQAFFHEFNSWMVEKYKGVYLRSPTNEEAARSEAQFSRYGFPGCVSQADGVHIAWPACPYGVRNIHIGQKGYPTLNFNVSVGLTRWIFHATEGFPGSWNDKSVVNFDQFQRGIADGELYGHFTYKTELLDGTIVDHKGAWSMVDGGYQRWPSLQCANNASFDPVDRRLKAWIEAVRKKVETVFGILKGRFRILKVGLPYHDRGKCERVFHTCCILHNMILASDGLDARWEHDVDWCGKDGRFGKEDRQVVARKLALVYLRSTHITNYKKADSSYRGMVSAPLSVADLSRGEASEWRRLNRCLAEHFAVMNKRGTLYWQKSVKMLTQM